MSAAQVETLTFEGASDDTFGFANHRINDDWDNCGSGKPIRWAISHRRDDGVIEGLTIVGQYAVAGTGGSWLIGVAGLEPEVAYDDCARWPDWPINISFPPFGYSPMLTIDVPLGVEIVCLERAPKKDGDA